jgi:hypothetical protein
MPQVKRGRPGTGLARSGPDGQPLEQINFRCSRDMARALLQGAAEAGGMRRFVAKLMREAGYHVPKWDTRRNPTRRTLD